MQHRYNNLMIDLWRSKDPALGLLSSGSTLKMKLSRLLMRWAHTTWPSESLTNSILVTNSMPNIPGVWRGQHPRRSLDADMELQSTRWVEHHARKCSFFLQSGYFDLKMLFRQRWDDAWPLRIRSILSKRRTHWSSVSQSSNLNCSWPRMKISSRL